MVLVYGQARGAAIKLEVGVVSVSATIMWQFQPNESCQWLVKREIYVHTTHTCIINNFEREQCVNREAFAVCGVAACRRLLFKLRPSSERIEGLRALLH